MQSRRYRNREFSFIPTGKTFFSIRRFRPRFPSRSNSPRSELSRNKRTISFPPVNLWPNVCTMEMGKIVNNLQGKTKVWPTPLFFHFQTANRTCLEFFPVTVRLTGLSSPSEGVRESLQIPTMADNGFQPFFSPLKTILKRKKEKK